MIRMIIDISRYILAALILVYSLQSFLVFRKQDEDAREFLFLMAECCHVLHSFCSIYGAVSSNGRAYASVFLWSTGDLSGSTLVFYRNFIQQHPNFW